MKPFTFHEGAARQIGGRNGEPHVIEATYFFSKSSPFHLLTLSYVPKSLQINSSKKNSEPISLNAPAFTWTNIDIISVLIM